MKLAWQERNWRLLPERALYWDDEDALILSDVHLGKAQDFQAAGVPVPASVHEEDLDRLDSLLERLQPKHVFILGDFVHSHRQEHADLRTAFRALVGRHKARFTLAIGNHDRRAAGPLAAWGFDAIVDEVRHAGLRLCHDDPGKDLPSIQGHIHPVVRFGPSFDRMRLPCFVVGKQRVLLPSFGTFTGGFEVRASKRERVFAASDDGLLEIPAHAR